MVAPFRLHDARLCELFEFVFTLPGLGWSLVNLSFDRSPLLASACSKLLQAGREVDSRFQKGQEAWCGGSGPWQRLRRDHGTEMEPTAGLSVPVSAVWPQVTEPVLEAEYRGIAVILKPRGWEVDGKGSVPNDCELLSRFVQARYARSRHPVVYCAEFDHGFIHRLDIPSSGLILTGTSFEGLYWIRWQLNVYSISREYHVLCQGVVQAGLACIDDPIDVRTNKLGSHRSTTCERGGPALTWVCVASQVKTPPGGAATAVGIRIRTGRKHQIRTHLRSSGHASAADGMYAALAVALRPRPRR